MFFLPLLPGGLKRLLQILGVGTNLRIKVLERRRLISSAMAGNLPYWNLFKHPPAESILVQVERFQDPVIKIAEQE